MTATVAPFTGAWIEIVKIVQHQLGELVAPFTGAWIEICRPYGVPGIRYVAPFTGAWIEIVAVASAASSSCWSLPSRERGLKLRQAGQAQP